MTDEQPQALSEKEIYRLAGKVAQQLGERDRQARGLIKKIITLCGIDFVSQQVELACEIQAQGGMLTRKEDRQRTLGGIFFVLVKRNVDPETWEILFSYRVRNERIKQAKAKKRAQAEKRAQRAAAKKQARAEKFAQQKAPPQAVSLLDIALPENAPAAAHAKLKGLQTAAGLYQRKLETLKGQAGEEMTRKMLMQVEQQIAALIAEYAN
jgi:hypothetical protein